MQNIVINMREQFHYDWLRNDRALGNRNSDNNNPDKNKNNNNVGSAWRPVIARNRKNVLFIERLRRATGLV